MKKANNKLEEHCCDSCKRVIEKVNDENDVMLNMEKYVYCQTCFDVIADYIALTDHGATWKWLDDTPANEELYKNESYKILKRLRGILKVPELENILEYTTKLMGKIDVLE